MKVQSLTVEDSDPFRAGLEIGTNLSAIAPEVIFVFTSPTYLPFNEFIEGIESAFSENSIPLIIGGTGDGYYETQGVGEVGASAIGINSEGEIKFEVAYDEKENPNTFECTTDILKKLKTKMDCPSIVYCLSDFLADGSAIAHAFNQEFNSSLIGGFLGNGRIVNESYGFVNKKIMKKALIFLAMKFDENSEYHFSIQSGSGWNEVSDAAKITKCESNNVLEINNKPATKYLEEITGRSADLIDMGSTSLKISEGDKTYMRAISNIVNNIESKDQSISLYGQVAENSNVKICRADRENVLSTAKESCQKIKEQRITPLFGLVTSCAGRKWVLVNDVKKEVSNIFETFQGNFPIAGFPSYGEFAPLTKYEDHIINGFHNVTYVILIIGKKL